MVETLSVKNSPAPQTPTPLAPRSAKQVKLNRPSVIITSKTFSARALDFFTKGKLSRPWSRQVTIALPSMNGKRGSVIQFKLSALTKHDQQEILNNATEALAICQKLRQDFDNVSAQDVKNLTMRYEQLTKSFSKDSPLLVEMQNTLRETLLQPLADKMIQIAVPATRSSANGAKDCYADPDDLRAGLKAARSVFPEVKTVEATMVEIAEAPTTNFVYRFREVLDQMRPIEERFDENTAKMIALFQIATGSADCDAVRKAFKGDKDTDTTEYNRLFNDCFYNDGDINQKGIKQDIKTGDQFNANGNGAAGSFSGFMNNVFPASLQSVKTTALETIFQDAQKLQQQLTSASPNLEEPPLKFYVGDLLNNEGEIDETRKQQTLEEIEQLHQILLSINQQQNLELDIENKWKLLAKQIPFLEGKDQEMLKFKNG